MFIMYEFFICIDIYMIYLFCFSGIIYDVIVEPPSIGSTTDEKGNSKPVSCYNYPTDESVVSLWLYVMFMPLCLWKFNEISLP